MVTPTIFFYFSKPLGIPDTEGKETITIIIEERSEMHTPFDPGSSSNMALPRWRTPATMP